jgi:hypothetical protein
MARAGAVCSIVLAMSGVTCNSRSTIFAGDSPAAPTGIPIGPPAAPVSTLFAVALNPRGTIGGGAGRGTVTLTLPAPPGGMAVTLRSSDPAVTVAPFVTVAAGADTAEFVFSTKPVASDMQVAIEGSVAGRSVTAALELWTPLPTFFSFSSDPREVIGRGEARRFTPANATFTAWCSASQITVHVSGRDPNEFWQARFAAPKGTPMRTGAYENAAPISTAPNFPDTSGPEMGISGNGAGCSARGRFVVNEIDVAPTGTVRRFSASFEQRCDGRVEVLRGDVSVTSPPSYGNVTSCVVR